jgi:hypothetical protein
MTETSVKLTTPESLKAGLGEIRRRRRLLWVVFLTCMPGVALMATFFGHSVFLWTAFGWMLAFAISAQYAFGCGCPRCGGQFASRPGRWHNPWTQRCLHCGLRLRATEAELREPFRAHEQSRPGAA